MDQRINQGGGMVWFPLGVLILGLLSATVLVIGSLRGCL